MEANRPVHVKKAIKRRIERVATKLYAAHQRDGGPSGGPSRADPSRVKPEIESSRSAFKSPFIFRGDLTPSGDFVYIDVEKLSLKKSTDEKKHQEVASSVAVVNNERNVIVWSFIKWNDICQTFPSLTGNTKEKLEIGLELNVIKPFINMALGGKDLNHDLNSLFIGSEVNTLDLTDYFLDKNGQKMKLSDVWKFLCGQGQDSFQCGIHSAIADARATRDVHKKMLELQKQFPGSYTCPLDIPRSLREPFKFDRSDVCRRAKSQTNKPLQAKFFLPKDPQFKPRYGPE